MMIAIDTAVRPPDLPATLFYFSCFLSAGSDGEGGEQ
jgi:hypothetical protein